MELNPLDGQLAVTDRHDHIPTEGASLEHVGQLRRGHERVVATDLERLRQTAEDRPAVVLDRRRLPVHRLMADDLSPPRLHERLVAEAYAERWDPGGREAADRLERDPGLVRGARPRRDDHPVIATEQQLLDRRVVVAHDLELGAELAQVLDEVVGEAVVVVDDEDPHGQA